MQKLKYINGDNVEIDLTDGVKYGITNWVGLSECSQNIQTQQVPFSDGAVFLDNLLEPRELSFTLAIQDSKNLTNRYTYKRELITALNPKLGEGYLVYTNDYLSRRIKVIPDLPIFENKNFDDVGTLKAELVFTANEPYWEDVNETSVNITAGEYTTINNGGDVPVQVEIDVQTESVDTFQVYSKTEEKKIKFTETMNNNFIINTNVGQKQINKSNRIWNTTQLFKLNLKSICYSVEKELYVAVGESGLVMSSKDGEQWTVQTVAYSTAAYAERNHIIYANNKFISAGYNGAVHSSDGENWTRSSTFDCSSIAYGNNKFVAPCALIRDICTSTDGVTWTIQSSGISAILNFIIYANNKFVAVGESGTIATSSDGTTWTSQTSGISTTLNSIIYNNGLYIAVGESGTILTSSDSVTWASQTSGVSTSLNSIAYNNDLYVIVGASGVILTSIDGTTWTSQTSGISTTLNSIIYHLNFIAVGENTEIIESSDGINWVEKTRGELYQFQKILKNNNFYLAYSIYKDSNSQWTGALYTSNDGINWTESSIGHYGYIRNILYINGLYFLMTSSSLYTSTDGTTWTRREDITLNNISYNNELYIGVSDYGHVYTSNDGISWAYSQQIISDAALTIITYGNGIYVIGNDYDVYISRDNGSTWTIKSNLFSSFVRDIIFVNNKFIAVCGTPGIIYSSTDGVNWTSQYQVENNITGVDYYPNENLYICKCSSGAYILSNNGEQWVLHESDPKYYIYTLCLKNYETIIIANAFCLQYSSFTKDKINLISKLSADSDMTLGLDKGTNKIRMTYSDGTATATIKYRQKYIGV